MYIMFHCKDIGRKLLPSCEVVENGVFGALICRRGDTPGFRHAFFISHSLLSMWLVFGGVPFSELGG